MPIKPTNLLRAAHTAALPTPRGATGLRALVVGGLVLTVLTYLALGGYLLQQSRHQHERRAEGMALNLAKAADNTLTANIEKIDLAIGAVVDDLEQQLASRQADGSASSVQVLDMPRTETQVRAQFAHRPELDGLRVTDELGLGIVGNGLSGRAPVSFADRDWFIRQRTTPGLGLHMSPPLMGKLKSVSIVSFSRRFNWPDGRFAGCVSASVPVSYFERLLAGADVGEHGAVVLRNAELAMLARHSGPASAALSSAPLIGHNKVSEQLRALVASGADQAAYFAEATGDGIPRTTVMRRLKVVPLVVTVGLAPLDYLQDWQVEVQQVMTLCAGVVLLNVLVALLLLRLLTQNRDAQRRIALLATVFEHSGEAIMVTDARFRILEVNPAFARQTGYAANEAVGQHPTLLASERTTIAN